MNRYRISKVILDHNLKNLNATSRFHWISHLLTDKNTIDTIYELNQSKISKSKNSFLQKGIITEKLVLTVDVLMSQTTPITNNKCKHISNSQLSKDENGNTIITIQCDKDAVCTCKTCNFLCKWFTTKNNYLFEELSALKQYLNNTQDNFYYSEIDVVIRVVNNTGLPNDVFDYLKEYIS
jgi:hypothetical protein